jgi:hypothetical protein
MSETCRSDGSRSGGKILPLDRMHSISESDQVREWGVFTDQEKLACVEREIALRRSVYALQLRKGLMSAAQCEREIALMESIAADYRAKLQPDLLGGTPT